MNAITAWYAGYESGVCTASGESRVKNVRGIEFSRESCEEYHHPPCRDIFCQGREPSQVYTIKCEVVGMGNRRRSQSQGMDAGEVSHRERMDELRPVVP